MRLRQLIAYLQSPSYRLSPTDVTPLIVVFALGATGFAMVLRFWWGAFMIVAGSALVIWLAQRAHRAALMSLSHATFRTPESQEWFSTVRGFADDGSLESRADPRMAIELEACADAHHRIITALEAPTWKQKSKGSEGWRTVAVESRLIAEDLMADALLVSRCLFRPKGGRHATFEKRCADPEYARRELGLLQVIRARIERLAAQIADDPAALEQADAYERTMRYLEDLRQAEEEVARLSH